MKIITGNKQLAVLFDYYGNKLFNWAKVNLPTCELGPGDGRDFQIRVVSLHKVYSFTSHKEVTRFEKVGPLNLNHAIVFDYL